jgi:hypothetical protein
MLPLAAACLLQFGLAISIAVEVRRATKAGSTQPAAGWRFVVGLVLGGLIVSGIATPALAATHAGEYAVPHGEHSFGFDTGHNH